MADLTGLEILELADGEARSLIITDWQLGEATIVPKVGPPAKRIRVLRVSVPPQDKVLGPAYWDITGQTLIEQLLPYLRQPDYQRRRFTITKHGIPPAARFQVRVD